MQKQPKFELFDALTKAATEAYPITGAQYNADVLIWDAMRSRRMYDPGGYLAAIINELGLENYIAARDKIERRSPENIDRAA